MRAISTSRKTNSSTLLHFQRTRDWVFIKIIVHTCSLFRTLSKSKVERFAKIVNSFARKWIYCMSLISDFHSLPLKIYLQRMNTVKVIFCNLIDYSVGEYICDVLRDLVHFVQFKKHEKHTTHHKYLHSSIVELKKRIYQMNHPFSYFRYQIPNFCC